MDIDKSPFVRDIIVLDGKVRAALTGVEFGSVRPDVEDFDGRLTVLRNAVGADVIAAQKLAFNDVVATSSDLVVVSDGFMRTREPADTLVLPSVLEDGRNVASLVMNADCPQVSGIIGDSGLLVSGHYGLKTLHHEPKEGNSDATRSGFYSLVRWIQDNHLDPSSLKMYLGDGIQFSSYKFDTSDNTRWGGANAARRIVLLDRYGENAVPILSNVEGGVIYGVSISQILKVQAEKVADVLGDDALRIEPDQFDFDDLDTAAELNEDRQPVYFSNVRRDYGKARNASLRRLLV